MTGMPSSDYVKERRVTFDLSEWLAITPRGTRLIASGKRKRLVSNLDKLAFATARYLSTQYVGLTSVRAMRQIRILS
jgi:hypothetical protein